MLLLFEMSEFNEVLKNRITFNAKGSNLQNEKERHYEPSKCLRFFPQSTEMSTHHFGRLKSRIMVMALEIRYILSRSSSLSAVLEAVYLDAANSAPRHMTVLRVVISVIFCAEERGCQPL